MHISDPVFLEAIKKLQEDNPQNYEYREIDLYNYGNDAINQQVAIIGNVLQVLDFPEYCEIYIRFNEITNPSIRLKKGICLFTFFRFFLTYEHTNIIDAKLEPDLLKFLIGKDIISVQYPTPVEKSSLELVPAEQYTIPTGTGEYIIPCKYSLKDYLYSYAFNVGKYNQIRGLVNKYCYTPATHYFYIDQFFKGFTFSQTKIELVYNTPGIPFIIDLVTSHIQFRASKNSSETWDIFLYAKAWC